MPSRSVRRSRWVFAAAATAFLALGVGPCQFGLGTPVLQFLSPLAGQLSAPGDTLVQLQVSPSVEDLEVRIDGTLLLSTALVPTADGFEFVSPGLGEGWHTLTAQGRIGFGRWKFPLHAISGFELVDLFRPDDCETLNAAHCMLPYPSTGLMNEVGAATNTGYQLDTPVIIMAGVLGGILDPTPTNVYDGFSPTVQILMHFPDGVDLAASNAPVLLEPDCCGQSSATPYVDVRTQDGRSMQNDSPTVLLDVDTGERILHWVELDANAEGNPDRQILFLRPGKALIPGHRYVVAVRNLVTPGGGPVTAEPVFRNLKFARPTTLPSVEARRERFEDIFAELSNVGVPRHNLVLAFDFIVRSHQQLTERLQFMRDDAYAYVDSIAPTDNSGLGLTAVNFLGDCSDPSQRIWRHVSGTFQFPYYLTGDIDNFSSLTFLNEGADRMPVRNGTHPFPFDIAVPCTVMRGEEVGHPLMLGHGIFGRGVEMVSGYTEGGVIGESDTPYVGYATDWRGLSGGSTGPDLFFLGFNVIGIGEHKFNNFRALPARLKQGQTNMLLLAHMIDTGFFNRLPIFWADPSDSATAVLPVGETGSYLGISLGGIHGTLVAALDPYTLRYNVDVPAMNFSLLEQRSTQFELFLGLIEDLGLMDPMTLAVVLQLQHEQWVSADPAAYARHITGLVEPPLPGVPAKQMLVTAAWLDKQVSNQATEILVRTLGIPSIDGSLQEGLQEIPDVDPGNTGVENGYVMYDSGYFDVFDPAFDAVIPPLANLLPSGVCDPHGTPRLSIPASIDQQLEFLRPGGKIFNFCDGPCDAKSPEELPFFDCDPLAP